MHLLVDDEAALDAVVMQQSELLLAAGPIAAATAKSLVRRIADGGDPPADVVPIEAPEGVHVIEHVRATWLPERATLPGDRAERILRQLARL